MVLQQPRHMRFESQTARGGPPAIPGARPLDTLGEEMLEDSPGEQRRSITSTSVTGVEAANDGNAAVASGVVHGMPLYNEVYDNDAITWIEDENDKF